MIDVAVVPIAGRGTSLLPLTKSQPKEMLPVGNKPVVQHVVDELIRCDVNRFLFITGPDKSAVENHFDIDKDLVHYLRISGKEDQLAELAFEREKAVYFFTRQRYQNGLGQAILCAEPFIQQQHFIVALGDTILGRERPSQIVRRMIDLYTMNRNIDAVIAFDEVAPEDVVHWGIAKPGRYVEDYFELDDLIEKPSENEAPSNLAVAARYIFSSSIFEFLHGTKPGNGGEFQLTDAIRSMIGSGKRVVGIRIPESDQRYDIGNFESYYKAFLDFALHDPARGKKLIESLKKQDLF